MNTYYVLGSEASVANTMTAGSTLRKLTDRGVYLAQGNSQAKTLDGFPTLHPPTISFHICLLLGESGQKTKKKKKKQVTN